MSIDFHLLIEAIDNNRLIIIDYIDYIDCLPMIDFHQLGTPGVRTLFCDLVKIEKRSLKRSRKKQNVSFSANSV